MRLDHGRLDVFGNVAQAVDQSRADRDGLPHHDTFRRTGKAVRFSKGSSFFENVERLFKGCPLQQRSAEVFHIVSIHCADFARAAHAVCEEPRVPHINVGAVKRNGLVQFGLKTGHSCGNAKRARNFKNIRCANRVGQNAGNFAEFDHRGAFRVDGHALDFFEIGIQKRIVKTDGTFDLWDALDGVVLHQEFLHSFRGLLACMIVELDIFLAHVNLRALVITTLEMRLTQNNPVGLFFAKTLQNSSQIRSLNLACKPFDLKFQAPGTQHGLGLVFVVATAFFAGRGWIREHERHGHLNLRWP